MKLATLEHYEYLLKRIERLERGMANWKKIDAEKEALGAMVVMATKMLADLKAIVEKTAAEDAAKEAQVAEDLKNMKDLLNSVVMPAVDNGGSTGNLDT